MSKAQNDELKKQYDKFLPDLRKAEKCLLQIVKRAISRIENKRLVRVNVRTHRVKSFESVRRKAADNDLDDCLSINDLVGARIVCNNIEDVYRFKGLLEEVLPIGEGPVEEQDYILKPKGSGYRALHLNFLVHVGEWPSLLMIPCEVQVRTLLQDSWAELVHSDIYKDGEALPEDLCGRTQDMADVLATADQIASRVRARVLRETKFEPESVRLDSITKEGLAYIFADVFGRSPSEYAVQRVYNACIDAEVAKVSTLRDKLANKSFRDEISKVYHDELQLDYDISAEDIFLTAPVAVAKGDEEAVQLARMFARTEREEVDAVWRNEVLSELPSSYDDFVKQLKMGEVDMEHVAEALGATTKCAICSKSVVKEDFFLEVISEHYKVDTDYGLGGYLTETTSSIAGIEGVSLCAYHACQASKDD